MASTELLITDITRMPPGYCVIGLERTQQGYRSVRPLPAQGRAWPAPFPFRRGDILQFDLLELPTVPPHVEDRQSRGAPALIRSLTEEALVSCLRRSGTAERRDQLFGCAVHQNQRGSGNFVQPRAALRSICGCDLQNIRFQIFPEGVRASLALLSGETIRDLPLVDRDWNDGIELFAQQTQGANRLQRVQRFLNGAITERVLTDSKRFARIGLTRLHQERHWLMLDSLFPLPQPAWLDQQP